MGFFSTPTEYTIQSETSPPPKLNTLFLFRDYGTDLDVVQKEFSKVVDKGAYRLSSLGCKLSGNFHQVTEFQSLQKDDVNDLELDIFIKMARSRTGIPSFGQRPSPGTTMVVFQVRHTFLTFDKSKYELLMPILGGCFYVCGDHFKLFPGPKFPMTHLLYGAGCELISGSEHKLDNDVRLKFNAEFKHASWFRQKAFHRIVLPKMPVSDFLSLKLWLKRNEKLEEPFILSEISIELQEFVSVHEQGHFFQEVKSQLLVKQSALYLVFLSEDPLDVCPDIALPDLGPSFYTRDLTRSYGLRISVKVSHQSRPSVSASAFMEINVAQEIQERIRYTTLDDKEYYGSNFTRNVVSCGNSSFKDYLPWIMADFKAQLYEKRKKLLRCAIHFHTNGSSSNVYYQVDGSEKRSHKRIEVQPSLTKHVFNFLEFMKQKGMSLFYPPVPIQQTSTVTLVTKKPVTGGDATNSNKPFASSCVAIGNQVAYSLDLGDRFLRAIRDHVLAIGEENYPLTIRLTPAGHKYFKQSQGIGESIIATAGMSLSELLEFTFMLPLSFRKIAACDSLVENYTIPLKRLTVTLFDLNTDYRKTRTVLVDQKRLPWIRWSGFTGHVPGNPGACSHPYSFHGIKGKLPDNLEPTSFGQLGGTGLYCLLVVLQLGENDACFRWEIKLGIAKL
ncbi:hypothetical protein C7M61_003791 [Candidozyma pseudohaemuli]|uniref:Uncharacterized protein n=1 Tax=Candidozyma pseudohaemuli TaxID=418784 RepID=A0A2P7YLS9_9ASCO|nr:hypothetical protein C7M61_003791 [[Candida] pseudohaemulonii]PSK36926.1 hypothetical protein C7M61_003791 [[Candida] pseudohaemulonii]